MKWRTEIKDKRIVSIRRRIFWILCIILVLLAVVISEEAGLFILKWLKLVPPIIGSIVLILLAIGWIMPGVFVILGKPQLAHKWLRRINPVAVSATPWEQLSSGQKLLTCIWSITIASFTLLAVVAAILYALEKLGQ
jgi:hypothetical protein